MSSHEHSDDGHDFAHPAPLPLLFGVFVALTILTIITVAQASVNFGSFDVAIVMVIATVKAILVGAFFMHLAFDKPFNIAVFLGSFVFVGLFIIFTISDSQLTKDAFIQATGDAVPAVTETSAAQE